MLRNSVWYYKCMKTRDDTALKKRMNKIASTPIR